MKNDKVNLDFLKCFVFFVLVLVKSEKQKTSKSEEP